MRHIINVTFNPAPPVDFLAVDQQNVDLQAGDDVVWQFHDLPTGCIAGIHFETPLGPFHSLRLFGDSSFVGKGNVGLPQGVSAITYPYRAQVVDANGSRAASTGNLPTITNRCLPQNTSPEVIVQVNSNLQPVVQPSNLPLNIGDTATWHIFGLPPDHFVTLFFPDFSDPLLGPFEFAYWTRAISGDDPNEIRGSATGFGNGFSNPEAPAIIQYFVQVRSADGQIVGSEDPVIDNLGDPPNPPDPA